MDSLRQYLIQSQGLQQRTLSFLTAAILDIAQGLGLCTSNFQLSLMLKDALDRLEFQTARTEDEEMEMLVYEAALFTLSGSDKIRYHPFLSHWVEVVRRRQTNTLSSESGSKTGQQSRRGKARILLIRRILESDQHPILLRDALRNTPKQLVDDVGALADRRIDLRPYITMLREEGIYSATEGEASLVSSTQGVETNEFTYQQKSDGPATTRPTEQPNDQPQHHSPTIPTKEDLLALLAYDPLTVRDIIVHLPITLPSLELLTSFLPTLQSPHHPNPPIDPIELARDFIQHALRTAELPSSQPTISSSSSSESSGSLSGWQMIDHPFSSSSSFHQTTQGSAAPPVTDRSERIRIVRLVVLFLRHLISSGFAGPERFLFEIQELGVRYGWVGEVRGLQGWLEGEDIVADLEGELAAGKKMGG